MSTKLFRIRYTLQDVDVWILFLHVLKGRTSRGTFELRLFNRLIRVLPQAAYEAHLQKIVRRRRLKALARMARRLRQGRPLRVGFWVSVPAMLSTRPLIAALKADPAFRVVFYACPDFRFSAEQSSAMFDACLADLRRAYGADCVRIADRATRPADEVDVMFPNLPYDATYENFSALRLALNGVPTVLVLYAYASQRYFSRVYDMPAYRYGWLACLENDRNLREYVSATGGRGAKPLVTGYCKFDSYPARAKSVRPDFRKTVMLAPHHSLSGGFNASMHLSNFLRYADFFRALPKRYPEILFIFRPHPVLFVCLSKSEFWGKEKADAYLAAMTAHPNVVYSTASDYLQEFCDSDALIQDCASYLAEYFYTGKPQCYLLKPDMRVDEVFSAFGAACLDHVYKATSEAEILRFIDDVVLGERDGMAEARREFARSEVIVNPHRVAETIKDRITREIQAEAAKSS